MTTLTADACTNLGILVPPTPDVRKAEDEIPELADAKLPIARLPLSPNTIAPEGT